VAVFVDLFVASFQLLKMRSFSPESLSYQQTRIFLQNKLPNLLSMISASSFNGFDTEQTITDAWGQVVPQLSTRELLLTGSRFLHTCSLHHLITHTSSLQLLGNEDMVSGMSKGLYTKDDLISQVVANHTRGPKLVEELVRSDGSAGFISHAVVEVERWPERRVPESMLMVPQIMHNYCHSKETQYLKDLANAIIRRPVAINCISLFVPPAFWLGPLCTLLDDWHWSEIHGKPCCRGWEDSADTTKGRLNRSMTSLERLSSLYLCAKLDWAWPRLSWVSAKGTGFSLNTSITLIQRKTWAISRKRGQHILETGSMHCTLPKV
jgi:mediator of RNA polymerase II transcription subunit 5